MATGRENDAQPPGFDEEADKVALDQKSHPNSIVSTTTKSPLDFALMYARGGWRILPLHTPTVGGCSCGRPDCTKPGKHPRIPSWQHDASSDQSTVTQWWTKWPDANIGLVLDGLAALDVDPRHGGLDSLAALENEYEPLEVRARQRSGSGGWHYLYLADETIGMARGFQPGLDFLTGSGCYICVEPSRHSSGGTYEWTDAPHPLSEPRDQIELTMPPAWLLALGRRNSGGAAIGSAPRDARPAERVAISRILEDALARVQGGEGRNNSGLWFFTQLRDNGYSREEATQVKKQWAEAANGATPGGDRYTLAEADASLKQAYRRAPRDAWKQPDTGAGLVQEIEKAIKAAHFFARDEGDLLYHFEDGVYQPKGEKFIKRAVKEYCETNGKTKSWSPELADKLVKYITVDAPELWERPPLDTLNVVNGLLDVSTRVLRPHSPDFLSPVQIVASYDPSAECPGIERFVSDVFPEDAQHTPYEIAAWLMLSDTSIQKAVLAVGEGSNGKSVFLTLLEDFLGKENISSVALHKIEADKFAAARLCGKLANICADLPTAALSGTSMFKALTGGDFINAERKYQPSFEFRPYARLVFSANTLPRSDDATHGFFRRWLVIPFTRTFDEKDPAWVPHPVLKARLRAELSGFLNRALDALPQVKAGTFRESQSLKQAWEQFRQTTDPLAVWLDANTVENSEAVVTKQKLRELFATECKEAGRPILSEMVFTERLRRLRSRVTAGQRTINGGRAWCFLGIGLKTQEQPPGDQEFRF